MIRKLSLISLFSVLSVSFGYAQTTVFAYVKDTQGKPIENVEVDLKDSDNDSKADKIGYFQFVDLKPGNYQITIYKATFEAKVIEFQVSSGEKRKDLGIINLNLASTNSDLGVVLVDDASSEDDSSLQPTVGLLTSGRDAFANAAAFELGPYWFRARGVDNRYEDVLFNGVSMSKNDDGRLDFGNWGGLNDVTRYPQENVENITPSEYTFGNLGGVVYYNTRASSYRKGVSLAYSLTNRSYNNRAMATYNTGLLKNGWAFTFSASRRWAENGAIDGTYQDAYGYFASIEKRLGKNHALNLTAFGSPTYRASNSPNTQEVYDLLGKDYNSYWGWQDGEKRNSRIRKVFEPVFQLSHYWKMGKVSNLNTTFSYQQGSDARSRLDWFHGNDPNPTYYRKLPSFVYYTPTIDNTIVDAAEHIIYDPLYQAAVNEWKTNPNIGQIDWTSLYSANALNLSRGAVYTVVEDVNKDKTYNVNSHFDTKLQQNWKLNVNFNYQKLISDNFRRVKDLLGSDFALNLDGFGDDGKFNVDDANIKVYKGDRTQYSYELLRDQYSLNVSTEIDLPKWNITASAFSSYSESQRDGKYRNYKYLNNSKGKSDVFSAFDAGLKARVVYKINGKNFIVYNGAYFTLAPTLNEIFINPRVINDFTPNVENQIINSNDLSYIVRGQILKLRISGYYTTVNNSTEISRYYADITSGSGDNGNALITEVLSGLNKTYKGLELGAEVKITTTLSATAVASYGDYTVTNNPKVYSFDNDWGLRSDWGNANIKGYKVAGTPQKAYTFGLRYNSPKFWWIGASANYLADQYLDFSALNKTPKMYTDQSTGYNYAGATSELIQQLTAQQKFADQFMLNANIGKSFLMGKYKMGASLSVNNILNNRNYVTGGFEQGRTANFPDALTDFQRPVSFFGPKLWYDRGTSYFANVYLRF